MKFTSHDPAVLANIWGPVYDGGAPPPFNEQEKMLRSNILDGSMSKARARRVVENADTLLLWPTRIQFLEALAALAVSFPGDTVRKLDGTKLTVAKMLYNLTSGDKTEWLFNNLRYRQFLSPASRLLLPSGTTSNEALRAELNAWYRQVQKLHRSTLVLKLGIQSFAKLLGHQTALHFPTTSQQPHHVVLAGAAAKPLWTKRQWQQWVGLQRDTGPEPLPLKGRKRTEQGKIKRSSGRLSLYLKESARSAHLSLCSAPLAFDGPAFVSDARGRDLTHMAGSTELICKFFLYSSIYESDCRLRNATILSFHVYASRSHCHTRRASRSPVKAEVHFLIETR